MMPTWMPRSVGMKPREARAARVAAARARGRQEAKATRAARKLDPTYVSPSEIRRGQQRYEANEVRAAAYREANRKVGLLDQVHILFEQTSTPGYYSNARRLRDPLPLKLMSVVGLIAWVPTVVLWSTLYLVGRGIYRPISSLSRLVWGRRRV